MGAKWGMEPLFFADPKEAEAAILNIGADPRGAAIMKEKAVFRVVKLHKVPLRVANVLKQTFLSKGADAAVSRGTSELTAQTTDMLLMGTLAQYRRVLKVLYRQPFGLRGLAEELEKLLMKT